VTAAAAGRGRGGPPSAPAPAARPPGPVRGSEAQATPAAAPLLARLRDPRAP
jgi:hypothetical protein